MPTAVSEDEIHLWSVDLVQGAPCVTRLMALLSRDEHERASAFYFPELRRRYAVARGALRLILGQYLQMPPSDVRFRYSPLGKPALADGIALVPITFNVSHSGELALIAVARGLHLGVDLEWMRPIDDIDGIAAQNFSPAERAELQRVSGHEKRRLFFTYWTRKESLVKATGDGLSIPLTAVDVSTIVPERADIVSIRDGTGTRRRFVVHDLDVPAGYAGALAAEGDRLELTSLRWSRGLSQGE